jgi:simple sugar transport system ATP-binding protein
MGNGQREILETVAGLTPPTGGTVRLYGEDVSALPPRQRLRRGLAFVPEDRQEQGLVPDLSASENLALGLLDEDALWRWGVIRGERLGDRAAAAMETLDVRPRAPAAAAATFSGGNQQKILLARALASRPTILLLAEPSRGLDVGAVERVHAEIRRARDAGAAVLLVSSDLSELLALSDRLLVIRAGRIVGEVDPGATDEEELGLLMTGARAKPPATSPAADRSGESIRGVRRAPNRSERGSGDSAEPPARGNER